MQRHSDNTQTQPVNLPPIDFIQIGIKHFVSGDISNSIYARITFDRLSFFGMQLSRGETNSWLGPRT